MHGTSRARLSGPLSWAFAALLAAALTTAPGPARASGGVPPTVHLQAALTTAAGVPATGSFKITARLYATKTATTALWQEVRTAWPVSGGLLDVELGSVTPLPTTLFASNAAVWLGITLNTEPETPRVDLRSEGWAWHARSANTAATTLGLTCSGCVTLTMIGTDLATQAELDAHAAAASAHHAKYTNPEAVAAMGAKGPSNPLDHDRFTAVEALAAMGAKTATNPLHHDRTNAADAVAAAGANGPSNPLNHDRYTDGEAMAAIAPYVQSVDGKTGGVIAGDMAVTGGMTIGGDAVCTSAGNCPFQDELQTLTCAEDQVVKRVGGAWACGTDSAVLPVEACTGTAKALQWDGTKFLCVDVGASVGARIKDGWGTDWDSQERSPQTWANAKAECEAAGARLPSVGEQFRVNFSTGSGDVGKSYTTSPLWSIIGPKPGSHHTVRLDNGTIADSTDATLVAFRCVWPSHASTWFTSADCYGAAGNACWTAKGEKNRYSMDRADRPALVYGAAVQECALFHARLASERDYTEEIQRGLPAGSNAWQWTNDWERNSSSLYTGIVRWSGVNTGFTDFYSTYASWSARDLSTKRAFRCIGVRYDAGANPKSVSGALVETATHLKVEGTDRAKAKFADAVSACWNLGGHLPTGDDLHRAIRGGLPNGSAAWQWTSDQGGVTAASVAGVKWTGVDPEFHASSTAYQGWLAKNASAGYNYRCVYYPIDGEYTGPTSCNGGCFSSTKSGATQWMDSQERALTTYNLAVRACNDLGGHLPTERDLTELIRAGLPNGSNAWTFTSDQEGYNSTSFLVGLVRWSGVGSTAFTDLYSTYSSWGYKSASTSYKRVYRCVWSNELR